MYIHPNFNQNYNQNYKGLVPLKDYKGVVLKLTEQDKKQIADLISERTLLQFKADAIIEKLNKIKTVIGSCGLLNELSHIEGRINEITEQIRNIKIKRKEELSKNL